MNKNIKKSLWVALTAGLSFATTSARGDDYAWATTAGSSLTLVDVTTGVAQQEHRFLIDQGGRLQEFGNGQMRIANVGGTLFGIANGTLYSIDTSQTFLDQNRTVGYLVTPLASTGLNNVLGLTWNDNANVFDVSTNQGLYTLTLGGSSSWIGNYQNIGIAGIAYSNGTLFGLQYSPSPGKIVEFTQGTSFTFLSGGTVNGASGSGTVFFGASGTLYADAGNNQLLAYQDGTLGAVPNQPSSIGDMQSFASAEGSSNIFNIPLAPVQTPEPSTTALLGIGGLGLLAWRLRCRQRAA